MTIQSTDLAHAALEIEDLPPYSGAANADRKLGVALEAAKMRLPIGAKLLFLLLFFLLLFFLIFLAFRVELLGLKWFLAVAALVDFVVSLFVVAACVVPHR